MLKYKGYAGKVDFDSEAMIFHGEVVGTRDVITFQGETPHQLLQAFKDSVDDYLSFCQTRGEEPEKPFSGKLNVRLPKKLHRWLAIKSAMSGRSINRLIVTAVKKALPKAIKKETQPSPAQKRLTAKTK